LEAQVRAKQALAEGIKRAGNIPGFVVHDADVAWLLSLKTRTGNTALKNSVLEDSDLQNSDLENSDLEDSDLESSYLEARVRAKQALAEGIRRSGDIPGFVVHDADLAWLLSSKTRKGNTALENSVLEDSDSQNSDLENSEAEVVDPRVRVAELESVATDGAGCPIYIQDYLRRWPGHRQGSNADTEGGSVCGSDGVDENTSGEDLENSDLESSDLGDAGEALRLPLAEYAKATPRVCSRSEQLLEGYSDSNSDLEGYSDSNSDPEGYSDSTVEYSPATREYEFNCGVELSDDRFGTKGQRRTVVRRGAFEALWVAHTAAGFDGEFTVWPPVRM
jgi:uncharacterized protein YjbI with pentapeptide repeats